MSDGNQDYTNIIDFYMLAYTEGWERSSVDNSYVRRKRDARAYANQVCPAGLDLIKANVEYVRVKGGGKETAEVVAGREMVKQIKAFCMENKAQPAKLIKTRATRPTVNGNGDNGHKSSRAKFKAACELGFVPTNQVTAALLGVDQSHVSRLRSAMSSEFDFAKAVYGYTVAPRKTKEALEIEAIESQIALLSEKVKALRGQS